jgi:ankyrin repeat protein
MRRAADEGGAPVLTGGSRVRQAVEMLLDAGAKPEMMDQEGKNAFDYAESSEYDDIVRLLAPTPASAGLFLAPALPPTRAQTRARASAGSAWSAASAATAVPSAAGGGGEREGGSSTPRMFAEQAGGAELQVRNGAPCV